MTPGRPPHPEDIRLRCEACKDLAAMISDVGLAVPLEAILAWDGEQFDEAERWARRSLIRKQLSFTRSEPIPHFFLK